jgi:hypothetical protein
MIDRSMTRRRRRWKEEADDGAPFRVLGRVDRDRGDLELRLLLAFDAGLDVVRRVHARGQVPAFGRDDRGCDGEGASNESSG